MKPGAGLVRLLAINALVLALLLALLAVLPPAAVDLYKLVRGGVADPRARLPIYDQLDWAAQHFEEFAALRTRYQDFIGWRRQPFAGTTITIDEAGYRRHPGGAGMNESEVWVFGGSAVWGPGVTDAGTIPARLQALSARPSFNFGEAAYTAHQSYNLLMKAYLLGGRPRQVVFYDGVNEVVHNLEMVANHQSSETQRRAGRLRAELQYGSIEEILTNGLHAFLTQFLDRVNDLGGRISRDFLVPAKA